MKTSQYVTINYAGILNIQTVLRLLKLNATHDIKTYSIKHDAAYWFKFILHPLLYIQGFIGNIMIIFLYVSYKRNTRLVGRITPGIKLGAINFLIPSLATTDLYITALGLLRWSLIKIAPLRRYTVLTPEGYSHALAVHAYTFKIALRMNTLIVLGIALERSLLVWNPIQHLYWCNSTYITRNITIGIALLISLATIPTWLVTIDLIELDHVIYNVFLKKYQRLSGYYPSYLYVPKIWFVWYEVCLESLCSWIPCFIIVGIKIKLIHSLYAWINDPTRRSQIKTLIRERETTCVVLCLCIFYLISMVPSEYDYLTSLIRGPHFHNVKRVNSHSHIELLQTLYFTLNFYIFLLANRRIKNSIQKTFKMLTHRLTHKPETIKLISRKPIALI